MTGTLLIAPALGLAVVAAVLYALARVERGSGDRVRRRQAQSPLAHHLPYWTIGDDGVVVGVDRTYAVGLALAGVDSDCQSAEQLERVATQLHNLVRILEPGVVLQWQFSLDQDHREMLRRYQDAARREGACAEMLAREKAEAIAATPSLRRSRLYLYVSAPNELQALARRLGARPAFGQLTAATDAAERERVLALGHQVARALTAAGFGARLLAGDELRALAYEVLNPTRCHIVPAPNRKDAVPFADAQTAREQLAFAATTEEPRSLLLDGRRLRVLTLSALPDITYPRLIEQLTLQLRVACRVQTAVEIVDPQRALDSLKRQRDRLTGLLGAAERENPEAVAQLSDLRHLIDDLVGQTQRIVRFGLSLVLSVPEGPDAERALDQQTADVLQLVAGLQGAQALVEEYDQLDAFLATLPCNAPHRTRWMTCTSENACDLFVAWQSWCGHDDPALLLENGRNYLVGLNPFASTLTNANAFVAGSSGAGKSVFTNYMLMHLFSAGVRGLIIDVGGSYRRLLQLFGGAYFAFDRDADAALNLFYEPADVVADDGELDPLRLQLMLAVIETLLVEPERPQLRKRERGLLNWAVRQLYRGATSAPLLEDLAALLRTARFSDQATDALARGLAQDLDYWVQGPYQSLLNRPSTVALTTHFAGFDLDGVPAEVLPTVVLILSGMIWNAVTEDRSERKVVVFDEVWTLLSSPTSVALLEKLYRTARKWNAGILTISQAVSDFTGCAIADALVNNSETAYILRHNVGVEAAVETFKLNDTERKVLEGLESRHGEYSEVLVLSGQERHFLGRVVLTPLEYWVATTHPPDLAALAKVQAAHPDAPLLEQLQICAARYPHGAPAALAGGSSHLAA